MTRRALCLGSALLLLSLGWSCSRRPETAPIDHVLLIVVDTLRADHLSAYGYERDTSPTLDALAREGVVFENAISQASWTLPSMVSMLTGSWVAEEAFQIPANRTAVAQAFQERGFATGAFIYNNLLSRDNQFHRGFDVFEFEAPPYSSNQPILEWIRAQKDGRSFTFIHLNEAHDPYGATDDKWPPNAPVRFMNEAARSDPDLSEFYVQISAAEGLLDDAASRQHIEKEIGAYDDDVVYTDEHIRQIIEAFKAAGIWDRTAVVIASDHGEGLWTRRDLLQGKRLAAFRARPTLVNALQMTHGNRVNIELVHVPLILRAPGLKPARVSTWVENSDIAPTLLELCNLKRPSNMNGSSLLELAHGPAGSGGLRKGAFSYSRFVNSLSSQDGMHLILPTPRGECEFDLRVELYDLKNDPRERHNIADRHPELVERLTTEIEERLAQGIRASGEDPTAQTLADLNAMGYVESGIWDQIESELEQMSTDAVLAKLEDGAESNNCVVRLGLVGVLKGRPLSDAQRARLQTLLEQEPSSAVQRELEAVLVR